MILSYDGFCFFQRGCPPLNFKIFISSNAFDNSSFFNQQPKFARLVCVVIAAQICSEIDTASRYPIPLYDTLISCVFSVRPFCNVHERICHFSLLFFTTGVNEHNHSLNTIIAVSPMEPWVASHLPWTSSCSI